MTDGLSQITLIAGAAVSCSDGTPYVLSRLLVDITAMAVSSFAVEREDAPGYGLLVPLNRISAGGDQVLLDCTKSEFLALAHADDPLTETMSSGWDGTRDHLALRHQVPDGAVEVVAGTEIQATDGNVGDLRGLVVDSADGRIKRILATVGHVFNKTAVAIPAEMVRRIDVDGVHLAFEKSVVLNLR